MKKSYILASVLTVFSLVMVLPANAELLSGPDIIAAPSSVEDDAPGAENESQQAFNEQQGVVLSSDVQCDVGVVLAGETVDSHMIFLNTVGDSFSQDTQDWSFDGVIVCVMSDTSGTLEFITNDELGASNTIYSPLINFRGLEFLDGYETIGNQITLHTEVTEPGDWIRVLTDPTQKKVKVCHVPRRNPDNAHTISIAIKARVAHLENHPDDKMGECL